MVPAGGVVAPGLRSRIKLRTKKKDMRTPEIGPTKYTNPREIPLPDPKKSRFNSTRRNPNRNHTTRKIIMNTEEITIRTFLVLGPAKLVRMSIPIWVPRLIPRAAPRKVSQIKPNLATSKAQVMVSRNTYRATTLAKTRRQINPRRNTKNTSKIFSTTDRIFSMN